MATYTILIERGYGDYEYECEIEAGSYHEARKLFKQRVAGSWKEVCRFRATLMGAEQ